MFALVRDVRDGPGTEKRFETHVRHVDLQYVADGHERILHTPAAALTVETPYDEATDITFYAEPPFASSLLMRPGDLAIFHPDDAHKPGLHGRRAPHGQEGGGEGARGLTHAARVEAHPED